MRMLKRIALLFLAVLLAFVAFYVWGQSGTLDDEALATTAVYEGVPAAAPHDTLTVVTYNIGYLSGMTNNRPVERTAALFGDHLDAAAALLRATDADLVAFQEIDFGARRSYDVDQLDALARRGGYAASATAINWDKRYVPFPSANPLVHFGRVLSGQAVLSRYPIRRHERVPLARPPTPFYYDAFYLERLAQVVEVDVGRPLVVINVHLEAWDTATRERQADAVRALYQRYAADAPVILLGDFNSLLPLSKQSPRVPADKRAYYTEDRTIETLLRGTGLREAFADSVYRNREALSFTYPADAPNVKIDHLFYDPAVLNVVDAYVVDGATQPSDHRAVTMRFTFNE